MNNEYIPQWLKLSKVEFMIEYLLERRPKGQGQRFVQR